MLKTRHKLILKLKLIALFDLIIICLPILIPLAIYVRKNTLRMPTASGERKGTIGSSATSKMLTFIGESPVVGVGVETFDKSLAVKTAESLSKKLDCAINWQAIGKNGINITKTIDSLIPKMDKNTSGYLVVCLGVNDTKDFTTLAVWEQEITRLIDAVKQSHTCEVFILGAPNMGRFPALPTPLGTLLGYRSDLLNYVTKHHQYNDKFYHYIPSKVSFDASYLAEDGFHPSEKGCSEIGKAVAQFIINIQNGFKH